MAEKLQVNIKGEEMKEEFKKEINIGRPNSSPIIKISHYDEDKHVKTDIYPVSHFLDKESKNMRVIRYS